MKLKNRILGYIAFFITFSLRKTLGVVRINHPAYDVNQPYLFAFWHGKQLLPVAEFKTHHTKHAVLVSPSNDGDILTTWLECLGYEVIRGSSRRENISGLAGMIRKIKQGYSLGFGIDGPIGPIYKVKPGMTHMAQKFKVAIVPVGSAFSRKWVFNKAWDKYEIPKPFAKAVLYLGKPIYIESDADLEAYNRALEHAINEAEAAAAAAL